VYEGRGGLKGVYMLGGGSNTSVALSKIIGGIISRQKWLPFPIPPLTHKHTIAAELYTFCGSIYLRVLSIFIFGSIKSEIAKIFFLFTILLFDPKTGIQYLGERMDVLQGLRLPKSPFAKNSKQKVQTFVGKN
jgi:hypothetical protein